LDGYDTKWAFLWDNTDEARFDAADVARIRRAMRSSVALRGNVDAIATGFDASASGAVTADADLAEETWDHLALREALIAHHRHAVNTDTLLRAN